MEESLAEGRKAMTSAHPPVHTHTGFHHHEWLWFSLSVALVALVTAGVMWLITGSDEEAAAVPAETTGFELDDDATAGRTISPGVTTEYFGLSGELYPAITVLPSATGFDTHDETTGGHFAAPGVTGSYFGYSGELYPAVEVAPAATGFDTHDDTTTFRMVAPGITTQYFGNSGELLSDD